MSRTRWWRRLVPPLLSAALLLPASAGPAVAATYQASIDVERHRLQPALRRRRQPVRPQDEERGQVAAYARLGHVATGFTGKAFTRAATLARTPSDWGYYVHSHGDYYLNSDGRRYTGFREDSGDCVQSVVFSKDIKAKRLRPPEQPRVHLDLPLGRRGREATTMPDAFAIAKTKTIDRQSGPGVLRRLHRRPVGLRRVDRSNSGSGTGSPRRSPSAPRSTSRCSARSTTRTSTPTGGARTTGPGWPGRGPTCPTCS